MGERSQTREQTSPSEHMEFDGTHDMYVGAYHTDLLRAGKLDHDTYPVGDPNSLADESLGDCRISRDFTMSQ